MFEYHSTALFLTVVLGLPSTVAYLLFAWDKHLAHYHRHRVPEAVLFIVSILMGAFGSLCAMTFFRHKTNHSAFVILIPILAIMQVAAMALWMAV